MARSDALSSPVRHRPRFAQAEAREIARELYGLDECLGALPGERDQNFLFRNASGHRFVLKIANPEEREAALALQNRVLDLLDERVAGYRFPACIATHAGEAVARVPGEAGATHLVRLLDWVPGRPLVKIRPPAPELLEEVGGMLGAIDAVLQELDAPDAERPFYWDLRTAHTFIRQHVEEVERAEGAPRRALMERLLAEAERRLEPRLPDLRLGLIHNDANDHNVRVRPARAPRPARVAGLIDFGDMVRSWVAAEPAVACAYAMLGASDPVGAGVRVAAGYCRTHPLREPEADALFDLAVLRLCLSAAVAAHQRGRLPEDEYLSISQAGVWRLLERLSGESADLPRYRFRETCGFAPCPATARVTAWLQAHAEELGPVVGADRRGRPPLLFDLSVESAEGEPADPDDTEAWTRVLFRRMEDAGVEVAIGRYDEVRRCYTAPAFQAAGEEGDEWRTLHLGADLFQAPGSPVYAPLDGTVHSLADNEERLDYGPTILLEHDLGAGGDAAGPLRLWTLYGHLSPDSLDGLSPGQPVAAGQEIGRIGDRPGNGDWPPHLHFQLIVDPLGLSGTFPGVAPPSQRSVWRALSPDPNLVLRVPGGISAETARTGRPGREEILRRRRERLGPNLSLAYRRPLEIVRGRGAFLYDAEGQPYLDAVNNVAHVGHGHPRVVEAGRRQMGVLNTNTRYLHPHIVRLAERLAATLPDPLGVCFFVCSGSEANELALRLARAHTGGTDVVVVEGAYHGNTGALVDLSPYKFRGPGGKGAPPYVHVVPMPDAYRGRYRKGALGPRYAAHLDEALAAIRARGARPAAFFCESLLSCAGQIVLPEGYLEAAYARMRAAGGVCVADEVQVGFGRVGTHFWGFQTQGVVPDVVTMGKPMGNGHPIAAVVTTPEIAASFDDGMEYFNTFGGNPVSCTIALAVLDVIENEGLQERARRVGALLLSGLYGLMERHRLIGDVRGLGLFLGVELVLDRESREPAPEHAGWVVERMKERGILLSTDGPCRNVIKIKPPLVFSEEDAERLVGTLDEVLGEDAFRLD